jgi:hypothetical protein
MKLRAIFFIAALLLSGNIIAQISSTPEIRKVKDVVIYEDNILESNSGL